MGALRPFIVSKIKKIVEVLMKKMKFFQMLWTVLLWTIVVDSFPVEQDNRDGRAGPASDLGDGRWQDAGYVEYLANRTESPYRSPDCCVVEEIEWGPTWEEVMEGNYTDQTSGWEPPTVKPPAWGLELACSVAGYNPKAVKVCGEDFPLDQHDDALAGQVGFSICNAVGRGRV